MTLRRSTKRARGRGRSNPSQASTSLGVKVDQRKIQKKGLVKGFDALDNDQKSTPFNSEHSDEVKDYNAGDDEEMQLIMDEIYQQNLPEHQASDANSMEKCIETSFGLSNHVRPSSGGSHVETDRRKVISLEGISNSSRRVTRSRGRGRSDPLGSSQSGIDPPLGPVQISVSPGVKNDRNRIQKKGQGKGVDTLNNKQKSTAFNSEQNNEHCVNNDEDEELQLIVDKICQSQLPKQQATGANNIEKSIGSNFGLSNKVGSSTVGYHVETDARKVISVEGISNPCRGRGKRGRGRGRSDPPVPSESRVDPPPPPPTHTLVSPGYQNDSNRGRGIKRGRGRGRSDPPAPSKSCVDPPPPPPPPPPTHTSLSPGVQNDSNRVNMKGLVTGFDALNNKQKVTAFNCEHDDEYCDYSDGEDEDREMHLIMEKIYQRQRLKQQAAIANNMKKYTRASFGLSNNLRPSFGGSHIETDRREVLSAEGISNPGRGIKRGRGRGRSDPPGSSQSCIDPPAAAHTPVSSGFQNVYNRVQRKGLAKGFDALNNKQKATAFNSEHNDEYYDYSDGEDEEIRRITEKIYQRQLLKQRIANSVKQRIGASFRLSNNVRPLTGGSHIEADRRDVVSVEGISNQGRRIKHGRGRGRSDPPLHSQSFIDQPPQPAAAAHTSVSPDRVQRKEHVKGFDALHHKQKATASNSEHSDEYDDYSDGEDEEMQLITEKINQQVLKQQAAIANNVKHCIGASFGRSDNVRPSSGGSHIEADRRNVVSVEGISNPGKGIKRGRGRGRHSDPPEPSQLCIDPQPVSTLNDTIPVGSSPVHESQHQLPTSKQCVGRESTQYWTVEAIDPQGAIKKMQLKYWLVNDLPIGLRVIVNFDDQGAAYGEAQGLLAGYCGTLATNCNLFPINFERWSGKSGVPKAYLDNCFETELKPRFQFRTIESLAKRYCKLSIAKKWASYRHSLWTRFYDPSKTRDQIISNIPLGVDPNQWAHFVDYRLKPETLEICRKNKENRSKQVIPHTGGSKSLSRKRHEMFLESGQQPCRGKLYIETHKKKDGSFVNDAAERIAEQIEEALAQSSVDELEMSPNDVVGRVFGPEHSGRVRCMGMGAAPTNTFRDSGVRLSNLRNFSTDAATSSSNFWQENYTKLESQVQNAMTAFKAYIVMKEGRIPDVMAGIFDLSNVDGVASEPNLPSNS